MGTMTETSTDKRLDGLRSETQRGFGQVDRRFENLDQRFDGVDRRFDRVEGEMHRSFERVEADIRELRVDIRELRADTKAGDDGLRAEIGSVNESVNDLRTLMIRFFAGTLGSIVAGIVVLLVSHS